jgi:cobalamin biosynthesis Mg chelatase CobN
MSEELLRTLITAGAGLLGVVIGVFSTRSTSKRTIKAALEQVCYQRAHERRDEILTTLYGYLFELQGGLIDLMHASGKPAEKSEEIQNLLAKADEFIDYYRKHTLWLSRETELEIATFGTTYIKKCSKLGRAFEELEDTVEEPNTTRHDEAVSHLDEVSSEVRRWMDNELLKTIRTFRDRSRRVPGIEEGC